MMGLFQKVRRGNRVVFAFLSSWLVAGTCFAADLDIDQELSRMSTDKRNYKPDALRKQGIRGLTGVLDRLFPGTAVPTAGAYSADEAAAAIKKLGHEDFKVRRAATKQLAEKGEMHRKLIERAVNDKDPETSSRAKKILEAWDAEAKARKKIDVGIYYDGLSVYLDGVKDNAMLVLLAQRTRKVLDANPKSRGERKIVSRCLKSIATSRDDQITDHLIPVLKHKDVDTAYWVTRSVGSYSGNGYFPNMLLHALKSDRERVVEAALSWTPNCWDGKKSSEVKRLVTAVFDGKNENLKFKSCFSMMHSYRDHRAIEYLLTQVGSDDKARAHRAAAWIGDSCNNGKKSFPKLLEHMLPQLKSKDDNMRLRVVDSLGTYRGPDIVDALIPMLGDSNERVRREAGFQLRQQRDKTMVKTRLEEAVKSSKSKAVRENAKVILDKVIQGR